MRILPTRVHGILDYLVALLLIAAPALFSLPEGPARFIPVVLGIATIIYSLLTDYELGLIRMLPMRTHLLLDLANGALLTASPWLFGFSDQVWVPHVIIGVMELVVTAISSPFNSAMETRQRA